MNSKASFDSLAITAHLTGVIGPVTRWEINLFSYLACLMSLYRGNPPTDWGYQFAATGSGSPFSFELDTAIDQGIQFGFLEEQDYLISVSHRGREELNILSTLSELYKRLAFVEPACSSTLAMPVGFVRAAVQKDSSVRSATSLRINRNLLEDWSLIQVQDQLGLVRSALGSTPVDLLSPAITWILHFSTEDLLESTAEDVD